TYHHTMFEMLGNWSFGDYFKKEAIAWAWELLTERYKLPVDRLYATVFEGSPDEGVPFDQEAYDFWAERLPASHILRGNKKDNFWEMGDTGPCGPCSEIHFDLRDDAERAKVDGASLVNKDHPQVIEIWNLVFMQFNRKANGSLEPLPARHVDTGMGFERLCMVIQGKKSNYDTDVFQPLLQKIAQMASVAYGSDPKKDIAMRVIADHLRAIAFSIADGQLPSNVKAGYVIRRILRRAVRYGYTYLGFTEPFICRLVPTLVEQMGGQFPELKAQQQLIEKVIFEEENSFLKTLATGINMLDSIIKKLPSDKKIISGADAFTLYDTYGFPIDLTQLIASEQGVEVDIAGFERELEAQKNRSRNASAVETDDWVEVLPVERSEFVGYDHATYRGVRIARYRRVTSKGKSHYQIVLDYTPFYGNMGGQVGDTGYLLDPATGERTAVVDTQKENNLTVHITNALPANVEAGFEAVVDTERRMASAANHTATHLMHHALREVLGTHVEQKGSLVTPDYLRFDFSHFQKVTDEELREVERRVNAAIRANFVLEENRHCTMEQAREMGAMMLFGEKYGDEVRVVKYGHSVELCGGLHVPATGNLGLFRIVSEESSAAGIRRIEAVTGRAAEEMCEEQSDMIKELMVVLRTNQVVAALRKMMDENAEMGKQMTQIRQARDGFLIEKLMGFAEPAGDFQLISRRLDLVPDSVKSVSLGLRERMNDMAAVFGSTFGGKPTLTVVLSDSAVAQGLNAGAIVREAAKLIQGGGGGQPHYATAGGKNSDGIEDAMAAALDLIKAKLNA
ncbi:alanine--tRNA ligase, partial [uncultured Rikenella sp.]